MVAPIRNPVTPVPDGLLFQWGLSVSICTSGEATVCMNGKTHRIVKGFLWLKFPGTKPAIGEVSTDYKGYEVTLSREFTKSFMLSTRELAADLALFAKSPIVCLTEEQQTELENLFIISNSLHKKETPYRSKALRNSIISFIYLICDLVHQEMHQEEKRVALLPESDRKYYFFVNFLDLLGKHCLQERSVSFYADKLFITPKYLSAVIKQASGRTAGDWIEEFVIMEAKLLLQNSEYNISEIADKLNFANISFFGKYFKRHTGLSPKEFKRSACSALCN